MVKTKQKSGHVIAKDVGSNQCCAVIWILVELPTPVLNYFTLKEPSVVVLCEKSEKKSVISPKNLKESMVFMKKPAMNWQFCGRLFVFQTFWEPWLCTKTKSFLFEDHGYPKNCSHTHQGSVPVSNNRPTLVASSNLNFIASICHLPLDYRLSIQLWRSYTSIRYVDGLSPPNTTQGNKYLVLARPHRS